MNSFAINRFNPVIPPLLNPVPTSRHLCSSLLTPLDKAELFDTIMAQNKELKKMVSMLLRERSQVCDSPVKLEAVPTNTKPLITEKRLQLNISVTNTKDIVCKNEEGWSNSATPPETKASTIQEDVKEESSVDSFNTENFEMSAPDIEKDEEFKPKKIFRRSIYKLSKDGLKKKATKKGTLQPKRSKAKHLWISYGRKIINYALEHTEGETQDKIREYDQKLISKKAYSDVFLIKDTDSQEEVAFKKTFREIALKFLYFEAEKAFANSNYCDDLLSQKDKVAQWIIHLTLEKDF